jgi:hypothetical protein
LALLPLRKWAKRHRYSLPVIQAYAIKLGIIAEGRTLRQLDRPRARRVLDALEKDGVPKIERSPRKVKQKEPYVYVPKEIPPLGRTPLGQNQMIRIRKEREIIERYEDKN